MQCAAVKKGRQHRSFSIPGVTRRHPTGIQAIDVSRNVRKNTGTSTAPIACINTLIYVNKTSRTLPTGDISLDSLTLDMPEAEDFM